MPITEQQLLGEIEDLLRTAPVATANHAVDADSMAWQGRAAAVLKLWDRIRGMVIDMQLSNMRGSSGRDSFKGYSEVMAVLHEARYSLRLSTGGPLSVAIDAGSTFDYFDALRKVIEEARQDLLFVDPYLDAEFVSKYLVHIAKGTAVRLLSRDRLETLIPAAQTFAAQSGLEISVRSTNRIHDRYVFVDRRSCYLSGASFKDGGKKAPTTVTQVSDAFDTMLQTYERLWEAADRHS